ncbi:hypothetical protein COU95_00425 [Candidatus Shapirobacteria bacterium CG10_big_fil_rev_8_21_14_0_10_40_9]|uniref:Aspartate aminotransferase family protein n=1 Tax=Candidatus Shapirobacteria bacterium CG10_big_fil_rev_8_21_14_0_10_40_9 TaxID=1974888 RepID=A0A2M8L4E4_9BACT|nr:MAG: hypothetical protein COU95_00425 [Candidatus Shapirobacteria bacterium CG10_big_fil_rev_8_21_14_0_10_40_9]
MFGVKTFIKNNLLYPKFLFPKNADKFPQKPVSQIRIKARLFGLVNKIKEQKKHAGLSNLITYPHQAATDVWKMLLSYNPNNLGNWSIKGIEPNQETEAIEKELISQMIDLYHGNKDELEGYVTSGGTEANIFSAWIGRKYLESLGVSKDKICLVKTSLTHHSVGKSADIIGVPTFTTALDERTWGMDTAKFIKTIKKLDKIGYLGFLVPLTLGYTLTGTIDPCEEICNTIRMIKKKQRVEFFVWIDAALNGLIEPFLNEEFSPFAFPEIQIFFTDFHKFGFVPIPAGIILYRRNLRSLIEKQIGYLDQRDNTVLGSRSGIAPVACWAVIHALAKSGFRRLIFKNKRRMDKFINTYRDEKRLEFVVHPRSLSCGIIIKNQSFNFKKLEKEFGLDFRKTEIIFTDKSKDLLISKTFFLRR